MSDDAQELARECRERAARFETSARAAERDGDRAEAAQLRGAALAARRQARRYEGFAAPVLATEV